MFEENEKQLQPGPGSQPQQDLTSAAAIKGFMMRVVAWPRNEEPGWINIEYQVKTPQRDKPIWISKSVKQIDEFLALADQKSNEKTVTNIYFCLSRQAIADKRRTEDAQAFNSIWADIDVKAKGYLTIEEAINALFEFLDHYRLPPPSAVVVSGSGMHVYWFSTRPLSFAEWRPYAEGLKAAALQWGLKCDAGVIANAAQVLRVPGTGNFKTDPPKRVSLMLLRDEDIDFAADLKALPGLAPAPRTNGLPEGLKIADGFKDFPPQGDLAGGISFNDALLLSFDPIKAGCAWLREAHDTGGKNYDQPQWNLTTLAAVFLENGNKLAHAFGNKHPKYSVDTTDEIWERKNREHETKGVGWPSCKAIRDAQPFGQPSVCDQCQHFSKGKSPLNLALLPQGAPSTKGVTLADFRAYLPDHSYIFTPTGTFWSKEGVNGCLQSAPVISKDGEPVLITRGPNTGQLKTMGASMWLDRNQPVHHLTWAPGHPMLIENQLIVDGGWIERNGVTTFNMYRPPTLNHGDPSKAGPWLELVHKVYPEDAERLILKLAHRKQRPQEKINHAVVMGGPPGIGKDTILEPVKRATGAWNFKETSPQQILGRFNGFLQSVIMRISEVRDLGEFNRYQFYEHTKVYFAAPPDVLRVDEKNIPEHEVINCTLAILTTNRLTDGIYLPPDDRRHDVMWSKLTKHDFTESYWVGMWDWYNTGGDSHVAAYLAALDISAFNPKAPPPQTEAFWSIVDANRAPEEGELQDLLDKLGNPDAITVKQALKTAAADSSHWEIRQWLGDRKNRRAIPHRFDAAGYVPVRNETAQSGLWVVAGARQVVYAKKDLTLRDQLKAVTTLQACEDAAAARASEEKSDDGLDPELRKLMEPPEDTRQGGTGGTGE